MKSFAALAVSVALATEAQAEPNAAPPAPPPTHVVLADLGLHVVGVGYQVNLRKWLAAQVALDGYVPWTENFHIFGPKHAEQTDVAGLVVRQRLFFHPFSNAPAGLWISPFAQYGLVWATRDGKKVAGGAVAGGLSLGWSFVVVRHLLLGLGAGAQYNAADITGGTGSPSFGAFRPTVDILLGYAF
jgi:hypothetical protein